MAASARRHTTGCSKTSTGESWGCRCIGRAIRREQRYAGRHMFNRFQSLARIVVASIALVCSVSGLAAQAAKTDDGTLKANVESNIKKDATLAQRKVDVGV